MITINASTAFAAPEQLNPCEAHPVVCFFVFLPMIVAAKIQETYPTPTPVPAPTPTPTPTPSVEDQGDIYFTTGTCPLCSRYIRFSGITTSNCPHADKVDGIFDNGIRHERWSRLVAVNDFVVYADHADATINPFFYFEESGTDNPLNYTAQVYCSN
ncbi:hypothetical protein BH09PAT2_BH09PAT2_07610 [soil metagenome]